MVSDEKIAEFIGIMLGDGSIGIYNTKAGNKIKIHHVLKVTLDSRNKEYIEYVANIIKEVLETEPKKYYKEEHSKRKENATDIAVYKKEIVLFAINNLGLKLSPKWDRMEIPKKYSSGELGLSVLKGLFDTDGHLSVFNNNGVIYPRIEIRLCPSPAQEQINNILNEFGFSYKVQQLERGKTRVRISGGEQIKKWFDLIGASNPIHITKALPFLLNR